MRFVVIGVGADGRSKVAEIRDVIAGMKPRSPGIEINRVWATAQQPPELPVPRRASDEAWLDVGLAAGATRWTIFTLDPGTTGDLHHTSTLDYDIVLSGEVTLGLDDGEVLLRAGDSVLIPGAMHSWNAGSEGCVVSVTMSGLAPVP